MINLSNKFKRIFLLPFLMMTVAPELAVADICPAEFPIFASNPNTYGVGCSKIPDGLMVEITRSPSNGKIVFFDIGNDGIQNELLFISTVGDGKAFGAPSDFGYNLRRADGSLVVKDGLAVVPAEAVNISSDSSDSPCAGSTIRVGHLEKNITINWGGAPIPPNTTFIDDTDSLCLNFIVGSTATFQQAETVCRQSGRDRLSFTGEGFLCYYYGKYLLNEAD